MKKWVLIFLGILLISFVSAEVRINEVNVEGNEWIELYNNGSDEEIINWYIADGNSNKTFSINISGNSYGLIIDDNINCSSFDIDNESCIEITEIGSGLNNGDDEVLLFNNSFYLIDFFDYNTSSSLSWQYCLSGWTENPSTPGTSNNCTVPPAPVVTPTPEEISIELSWDEEDIINGGEFEISIKAENLESEDYDVMVWIENEDDECISERYGNYSNEEIKWADGKKWAYAFLENGDEREDIKIRIDEDYEGDGTIYVKIREHGKTTELDSWQGDIEILESEEIIEEEEEEEEEVTASTKVISSSSETIKLGSSSSSINSDDKTTKSENSILYKSKNEYIREYLVYGFALLCIGFIALLLIDKK